LRVKAFTSAALNRTGSGLLKTMLLAVSADSLGCLDQSKRERMGAYSAAVLIGLLRAVVAQAVQAIPSKSLLVIFILLSPGAQGGQITGSGAP
jgi:hypothetical protein